MKQYVYVVLNYGDIDYDLDAKVLGVYSSRAIANNVREKYYQRHTLGYVSVLKFPVQGVKGIYRSRSGLHYMKQCRE